MESRYISRFAELYERQGRQIEIMGDKFWTSSGRAVIPIGPITRDYSISEDQAHQLMKKFHGALMVKSTNGYGSSSCDEWYAVICDEFKDLEFYNRKHRYEIKKGLRNCKIRQVDADFIAKYGYAIYLSAFSRYQEVIKPDSENEFIKIVSAAKDFDDIYHYWGAFYNEKFIGYFMVAIHGNEEANLSAGKIIPEYLNLNPTSALVYTLTHHYLINLSMGYVNSGFRSIYHKTNVQHNLLTKLSYKKKSLNLLVTYNYLLKYILKFTYPFSNMIGKMNHNLHTLYILEQVRQKCRA